MSFVLAKSIDKGSLIDSPIGIGQDTTSMSFVVEKVSIINTSILPFIDTTSVSLHKFVFPLIGVTIAETSASIAMPLTVDPVDDKKIWTMDKMGEKVIKEEMYEKYKLMGRNTPNTYQSPS